MDTQKKLYTHPLYQAFSTTPLISGHIVVSDDLNDFHVVDSNGKTYLIDARCRLLSQLSEGDHVIFCVLDNGQTVVLNQLIPQESNRAETIELKFPGVDGSFIRITEKGIHLQAGKTKLLIQKDGNISFDALNLEQTAQESLKIRGGIVQINTD